MMSKERIAEGIELTRTLRVENAPGDALIADFIDECLDEIERQEKQLALMNENAAVTDTHLLRTEVERDSALAECEKLRMQLAACGVATKENTRKSREQRINKSSPFWTASYGDICEAVDREIALREECERLRREVATLRQWLALHCTHDDDCTVYEDPECPAGCDCGYDAIQEDHIK